MSPLTLWCLFILACSQVSAEQGTEAIVGGHYAKKGDFKYHARLRYSNYSCGGAIINDQFILTAAHCVMLNQGNFRMQRLSVILGTHDIHDSYESIITYATAVYIPKNYDFDNDVHDIALVKLANHLQLSHHHKKLEKVNLPKPDGHYENACAIIAGFGDQEIEVRKNSHGKLEEFGGKHDGKLKYANVRVITNQRCKELNRFDISPSVLCGQALQENKHHFSGVCDGDSGGPLVHGGEVIGISSLSPKGCDESKGAAVYTRVSSYLHFINSVIHGHPGPDVAWTNIPTY